MLPPLSVTEAMPSADRSPPVAKVVSTALKSVASVSTSMFEPLIRTFAAVSPVTPVSSMVWPLASSGIEKLPLPLRAKFSKPLTVAPDRFAPALITSVSSPAPPAREPVTS